MKPREASQRNFQSGAPGPPPPGGKRNLAPPVMNKKIFLFCIEKKRNSVISAFLPNKRALVARPEKKKSKKNQKGIKPQSSSGRTRN